VTVLAAALYAVTALSAAPDPQAVHEAALDAQVEEQDLLGALLTVGEPNPREYLYGTGELVRPYTPPAIPAAVTARVACIEAKESGGANVWNRRGSGAGGVLQYMESTFRRSAVEMGHPEWSRWEPWQARLVAAHDLMRGRRAQWTVSGC
jgi:hypothetical protein